VSRPTVRVQPRYLVAIMLLPFVVFVGTIAGTASYLSIALEAFYRWSFRAALRSTDAVLTWFERRRWWWDGFEVDARILGVLLGFLLGAVANLIAGDELRVMARYLARYLASLVVGP
jgi:hypothetical protein